MKKSPIQLSLSKFQFRTFFFKSEDKYLSTTSLSFTRVLKNHVWIRSTYFSLKNIFLIFKKFVQETQQLYLYFTKPSSTVTKLQRGSCIRFVPIFQIFFLGTYCTRILYYVNVQMCISSHKSHVLQHTIDIFYRPPFTNNASCT